MSVKDFTANVISKTPIVPDGNFKGSKASGVWDITEQFDLVKGGNWPSQSNGNAPFGFFFGGEAADQLLSIDRFDLSSAGNATDFGDLDVKRYQHGALGSGTRGVIAGGFDGSFATNRMTYITFGSTGSGADFGNLTVGRRGGPQSVSNDTRGVWICGRPASGSTSNVMDYITIATEGNATDFGDANVARGFMQNGGASNGTRGVTGGGEDGSSPTTNSIEYITIASTGNGTDFGNMTEAKDDLTICSNATRGIFFGGASASNTIEYITIASTGNGSDFGDLTAASEDNMSAASPIIAICGSINGTVTVDQITIASTGNATDFGDQLSVRNDSAGASNAHGGL